MCLIDWFHAGPFYDFGLLYASKESGQFNSTSLPAYRAMLDYYFDSVVPTFVIDDILPTSIQGYRFKSLMLKRLQDALNVRGWTIADPKTEKVFQLESAVLNG